MKPIHLFEAFGIEIEHMIVDQETLEVRPFADRVLVEDGEIVTDIEDGPIAWSNELALHVIELKTNGPAATLEPLPELFRESTRHIQERLAPIGCTLLPGAMHPLMNPDVDFRRWPHDGREIYATFDRIFDCRGHGWSNLQSVHLNLPFTGDEEFGRLHAAIRVILPIIPALSAASPFYDGRRQPFLDARLDVYRHNAHRVPFVSGRIIPERAFSRDEYDAMIFDPLYEAIAPHDTEDVLRYEWLNSRGAIARFDRNAIEIRVIDAQEDSLADVAICAAVTRVLQRLVDEDQAPQRQMSVEALRTILDRTVADADEAIIDDAAYLSVLGFEGSKTTAAELWRHLLEPTGLLDAGPWVEPLKTILDHGPLARRLVAAVGDAPYGQRFAEVYRGLVGCLLEGRRFVP